MVEFAGSSTSMAALVRMPLRSSNFSLPPSLKTEAKKSMATSGKSDRRDSGRVATLSSSSALECLWGGVREGWKVRVGLVSFGVVK